MNCMPRKLWMERKLLCFHKFSHWVPHKKDFSPILHYANNASCSSCRRGALIHFPLVNVAM